MKNPLDNKAIRVCFEQLSTPLMADAIIRLGIPPRAAAVGIKPLVRGTKLAGRVLPVRHHGSVDVFFEVMLSAQKGDVLVIDNQGRKDEGCVGDLTALEARAYDISGMIIWGCHRDTHELIEIGFPLFSYGSWSFGPLRADRPGPETFSRLQFGSVEVRRDDVVFADDDGVIFAPLAQVDQLLEIAQEIRGTERRQIEAIADGKTMHDQLQFGRYLELRRNDPAYTFRKHLRVIGGAIEE